MNLRVFILTLALAALFTCVIFGCMIEYVPNNPYTIPSPYPDSLAATQDTGR